MNNDLTEKFENASTPQELIVESEKVQIADPIVEEKVIDQSLIEEKASVEDEVIAEVKKEEVTKPKLLLLQAIKIILHLEDTTETELHITQIHQ